MHAISSYRGNRPTHIQTHPPTHKQTGPITIHCAAASVQCNQYCGLIHYLTHPSIFKQYKLADAGTSLWCTKFNNQAISLNDVLISRLLTIPDSGYCLYAYKELHGAASKHPIRACVRRWASIYHLHLHCSPPQETLHTGLAASWWPNSIGPTDDLLELR